MGVKIHYVVNCLLYFLLEYVNQDSDHFVFAHSTCSTARLVQWKHVVSAWCILVDWLNKWINKCTSE